MQMCGVKHIGVVRFCWGGIATYYTALNTQKSKLECHSMVYQLLELSAGFIQIFSMGIIREREDRHKIKSPVLFIFADNDS